MKAQHTVDPAIEALKELRSSYRAILQGVGQSDIDCCRVAHDRAVEALCDLEVAGHIDAKLKAAHESSQASVSLALENLHRAEQWMIREERRLAQELGFSERLVSKMIELGKRSLQSAKSRGASPAVPDQTKDLVELLERTHHDAIATAQENRKISAVGQKPKRKPKKAAKAEAFGAVSRALVIVGFIVVNSKKSALFHHSLAISIGVAASDI